MDTIPSPQYPAPEQTSPTTAQPPAPQSTEELLRAVGQQLAEQNVKIDAVYKSSERLRKYFMWTLIITVATIVLPLIGLAFVVPYYLSSLQGAIPGGL